VMVIHRSLDLSFRGFRVLTLPILRSRRYNRKLWMDG
jgi:hypothetical protein